MKVVKLFVIGILAFPLVLTLPTQLQKIDATLPECEITKNSLFCDFKESDRDNVYLEPVNETIDKVYINNLRNVQLSSALCTNMALVNVGNVTLVNKGGLPCEQGFDLAAKDTMFDRMPVQINKIYLENCNVSSLVTGATLTKLTVIQSHINSLDISYPLTNDTSFTFKESSIGVLQSLVIDGWPEFIMKDTTILYIPPEGLIVKHGVLSMKGSSFINATKDSIIIYPNATLDLENYSGNLKFSNMLIPTNKQVFSGAEESETDFFYPFVICLFLLIVIVLVCLIILSIWYYKKKGELCNQHVPKYPSDAKEVENEESRKLIEDEFDLCGGDVGKKKQKNTTQSSVNVTSETRQQSKSNTLLNKDRNTSFETEVDSQVNASKGNEMSSKIKEDAVTSGKRKSISNKDQFSKEGKNREEKASHPHSSDRHNLKNTNNSQITSVPDTSKRTVEDAKAGDDEDKDIDQTLSPANPPPLNDMLPEPEDMITDNVILFTCFTLTQKDKSNIPHAISVERVKVGLKKNTYAWSEVNNEILSRNPNLSSLQVIKLEATDFYSIRNGEHLSKMNKKIIRTIKESNKTGTSSLPPGQEGTKGYGDEVRTNPGEEHITQEVGNISTSEQTEQFEMKKNGSNGSNLDGGVGKGSNSLSENSSKRNRGTEDMLSGPNQNNTSVKNEDGDSYIAEAMDVNEVIPKTHTTNMSFDNNETGSGDRQDKLNKKNPLQGSPESTPSPKTYMITELEDSITDNVVLLTYIPFKEKDSVNIESVFKSGHVKAVLKKKKYEWNQVYKDILGYKLKLSNLQWMEISILDFRNIKNGDLFTQICLDHTQKTQNPIPDGSSPSTSQEETKEDRLQEEHTKEQITGGGDGNSSNNQYSGPPATEGRRSAEVDPLSGGTSGRKLDVSSPSTSQEETEEDRLQEEHTKEQIPAGGDGNGSNIQYSGPPATKDTRSAEDNPLSGGTSGRNSFGENSREGIPSHTRRGTENDSSGSVSHHSKPTEVESDKKNTITDNPNYTSSPSTSQNETKENKLQREHTKERTAWGGDENGSTIQDSGSPATEDRRSAKDDSSSGGTSGKKSLGDNTMEGIPSRPRRRAEEDSSGSVLHRSKSTEVKSEQENTITDNVVLFRDEILRTIYLDEIPNVIARGEVKVALKKDKYKWDRVNQDIYKYRKTFPNLPLNVIHPLDFKKIKNGDSFWQIDLHHTNKTPNPRSDGISPSTSQEESKEDRPQGEHTKEHITAGGDGNGSNIQQSGTPATKDRRSTEGDPSSGGTSGRKSSRDGNHSHTRRKTEKDSSGSVSHRSKPTEVEPEQENTITDNIVLFRYKKLYGRLENDIHYAITMGYVKVALKKDEYKWDRVNQDIYKYRETLPNLSLIVINHLDFMKIKNGDPYWQIDFHYTNKASNPRYV